MGEAEPEPEDDELYELPAWSLSRDAGEWIRIANPLPERVDRGWALGGATGKGVRVCILDSGVEGGHPLVGDVDEAVAVSVGEDDQVEVREDEEGDLCGHLREGFAADAIGYIQIADHPGRNEPGTGELNYSRVFKELKALRYNGAVGLELVPKTTEEAAAQAVYAADRW